MSDETPAMPSNTADDEASEAAARDLDVDQLRAAVSRQAPTLARRQHDGTMGEGCTIKAVKPTSTINHSRKALLCRGDTRAEVRGLRDIGFGWSSIREGMGAIREIRAISIACKDCLKAG